MSRSTIPSSFIQGDTDSKALQISRAINQTKSLGVHGENRLTLPGMDKRDMPKYLLHGGTWSLTFVPGIAMAHSSLRYLVVPEFSGFGRIYGSWDKTTSFCGLLARLVRLDDHCQDWHDGIQSCVGNAIEPLSKAVLHVHGCPCIRESGQPQSDRCPSHSITSSECGY